MPCYNLFNYLLGIGDIYRLAAQHIRMIYNRHTAEQCKEIKTQGAVT